MTRFAKLWAGATLAVFLSTFQLLAGGSGLNVAIIINQDSTNSIQLGNYYRQQRNVPPQNVFRIYWPGTNVNWSLDDYTSVLLEPFESELAARQLTNQIDYVVLSMDIPYRVDGDSTGYNENSTTSSLFYGFWSDDNPPCDVAIGSTNLYAGSEGIFRQTPPVNASSNSWLVTMITQTNAGAPALMLAEAVVNQGVAADSSFPTNTFWLIKSTDVDRNVRWTEFDNAIFNAKLHGNYSLQQEDAATNAVWNGQVPTNDCGYLQGIYAFYAAPNTFVPGAMADNLTSFSGQVLEYSGQTTILSFLAAGATASYGTVIEPCAYLQKFPDAQDYFYELRGYSLAESYYMSVTNPYQGLTMGEPLSAPFAQPAAASWIGLASNAVLSGTPNLTAQFTAHDALHPVQQVDLFLDGQWLETVTNIQPQAGNVLSVTLRGFTTTLTVTNSATIKSLTAGLVNVINSPGYASSTHVQAFDHGDRVELQSTDSYTVTGSSFTLAARSTNSSGALTSFVRASGSNFLDSVARGYDNYEIMGTPGSGSTLQLAVTKTNGTLVTITATNPAGNTDLPTFTQQFMNMVNTNSALDGTDGLTAEDLTPYSSSIVTLDIRALGLGYAAAQIRANFTSSDDLTIFSNGNLMLIDNLNDLTPRGHLYVTAGASNLTATFPFATTGLADGYHELDAVVYEGSHVRTQARASQNILIQNTPLSATLNTLVGGSNVALEGTLEFSVTPNTNAISQVELFTTGGLAGSNNVSPYGFSIAATNLGIGLHPFYALVTDNLGNQYRTATTYMQIIGAEPPFDVHVSARPLELTWPATAGRSYQVLATTNLVSPFAVRTTLLATNNLAQWTETNANSPKLFYQIRVSP